MLKPSEQVRAIRVVEWNGGDPRQLHDEVAIGEPIEIRVGGASVSVAMRTPGDDFELAAGFLFTERIVCGRDDLASIVYADGPDKRPSANVVNVTLRAGKSVDPGRLQRHFYLATTPTPTATAS
jgi:FdhD protein